MCLASSMIFPLLASSNRCKSTWCTCFWGAWGLGSSHCQCGETMQRTSHQAELSPTCSALPFCSFFCTLFPSKDDCFFQTQITFSCCKSSSPSDFFSAQLSQQTSPHLLLNVSDSVVQAVSCRLITRGLSNRIWCYPKLLICFKGYNFLHSLEGNKTHYIEETGRSFTDLVDL